MNYYHVTTTSYVPGQDIYTFDALESMGETPEWKFEGEPFDTDAISLFTEDDFSSGAVEDFLHSYCPGGCILVIDFGDDQDTIPFFTNSEGYVSVSTSIPSKYIKEIIEK